MKITPARLTAYLCGIVIVNALLIVLVQAYNILPAKIVIALVVSFLPGFALLRLLKSNLSSITEWVLYSLGLSVLIAMVSGLLTNQVLHAAGVERPLTLPWLLLMWTVVTLGLIIAGSYRNRKGLYINWARLHASPAAAVMIGASLLIPLLAAFGAFRLNNGGDAVFAVIALLWIGTFLALAFFLRKRLSDGALAWSIFAAASGILLMTSLRGWDITGHDIMREFRVYTLAHQSGHWDIAAYRDPYNACLSITILPEMYAKFLDISGVVVFKLILQLLSAATAAVMYMLLRRFVSKLGALVGCVLFICYPTFINDSAMLTRQGIAYLFFALALAAALRPQRQKVDLWLFGLGALGVVLSHYSTSYMFVALFGIAVLCKLIIERSRGWRLHLRADKSTVFTPTVLIVLVLGTFLWYAQFTETARGVAVTVSSSISNIPHLFSSDNKSSDTSASLFMATSKTQADVYQGYLQASKPEDLEANTHEYMPNLTGDDIPVTEVGEFLSLHGADPTVTADLRQNFAKVLQLVAAVSVIYATYLSVFYTTYLYARKRRTPPSIDLMCLSIAGIILLIGMVVLPTFSVNYGVLRTFQQSLIFLVVPLAVALTIGARWLRPKVRSTVAIVGSLVLFALFSGLIAQMLGGVSAPLTLNNRGLYYGLYYTTKADLMAYSWMRRHLPENSDVRAASFSKAIMHDPTFPYAKSGILPLQKPRKAYVYLDQAQTQAQKFYVYHEGDPLITTFPLKYYADKTDQLYSTATTGIYK